MIGVDIIDLSCSFSQSKYSLSDYKRRILNTTEYCFCENFIDLDLIWAMKESAYKCYSKQTNTIFFNPKKILITSIDKEHKSFTCTIRDYYYKGNFEINSNFIYAITMDEANWGEEVRVFIPHSNEVTLELELEYFFKTNSESKSVLIHQGEFPCYLTIGTQVHAYSRSHHGAYFISVLALPAHN